MKVCLIFFVLYFLVGIWKKILKSQSIFVTSIYIPLALTVALFSFNTWMATQHKKVKKIFHAGAWLISQLLARLRAMKIDLSRKSFNFTCSFADQFFLVLCSLAVFAGMCLMSCVGG